MCARLELEILDCNDPLLKVKIPKNPFSHVKTAREIGYEKQLSSELSRCRVSEPLSPSSVW